MFLKRKIIDPIQAMTTEASHPPLYHTHSVSHYLLLYYTVI